MIVKHRYAYENQSHPKVKFEVIKDSKGKVLNPGVVSMTNQADAEACDLNVLFEKYQKTGVLIDVNGNSRTPVYGDFSEISDYHTMKIRIADAEQKFALFPPKIRNRFNNDVQEFLNFMNDSKNDEESVSLGLKHKDVLLTELADDGKTKISKVDRANLDAVKARAAAAASAGASGTGNA